MRVCLISREYPPDTGWGGIATFTQHLALGLRDLGHEVEVVALAVGPAKEIVQDGLPVHRVEMYVPRDDLASMNMCMPYSRYVLKATTALWKRFLQLHEQKPFDVVDTPELLAEGLFPSATKAAPVLIRLYTPHSKFIAEGLHNVKPSFDHLFVALLERVAMRFADVITSPSEDLADFVAADMGYPREQIKLVRNPIDPDTFCPEGERLLQSDGRKIVLFVGRLEERKGVSYFVDAIAPTLKAYKNVRFVIIGDDTINAEDRQTSVLAQLKSTLGTAGCLKDVEFIDRVPLADLPKYYRSADICVVPSVYDNSPYTCLESMSCGRAVIGTTGGGTREYIVDGESGVLVEPRNASAISGALIRILSDDSEQQRLGNNARKRVLDKFQRKEIARQTAELYELARSRFNQNPRLYLKEPSQVLSDAEMLMTAFDKMLYDLCYQESTEFRVKHWIRLGRHRPKLLSAKVALKTAKGILRTLSPSSSRTPRFISSLERQIVERQELDNRSNELAGSSLPKH